MNNVSNGSDVSAQRTLFGTPSNVAYRSESEKTNNKGNDKPRVLRMSSTLRRMLNEVDAAQTNPSEEVARA